MVQIVAKMLRGLCCCAKLNFEKRKNKTALLQSISFKKKYRQLL